MRYVRFLKTPRIVVDAKSFSRHHVVCLITITSDLGDSFLPYDIQLSAELLTYESHKKERILVWSSVQWTAGMRSLVVKLPLPHSHASSPLRLKIGAGPKSTCDEYHQLSNTDSCGVITAWSARFTLSEEAARLAERRFLMTPGTVSVWEETGNSIARHLW